MNGIEEFLALLEPDTQTNSYDALSDLTSAVAGNGAAVSVTGVTPGSMAAPNVPGSLDLSMSGPGFHAASPQVAAGYSSGLAKATHLQQQHQQHLHPAMTSMSQPTPQQIASSPLTNPMAMSVMDPTHSIWPAAATAQATTGASITEVSATAPIAGSWDTQSTVLSTFPQHYLNRFLTIPTPQNLVSYEMYVKVAYRSCAMAAMRIAHRDGCRLFYGHPPPRNSLDAVTQERLFGSRKLLQLSLPPPRTAQSILPSMWKVLEHTHRGIILQMDNNDVYATRLCPATTYYQSQDGDVIALERCVRTLIFSFERFLATYERYKNLPAASGRLTAREPPCYEILMSIGQHWGPERMRDNNLISLNITHCLGEKMIESLRQEYFKQRAPFDTDYMSVDDMDEDDRRAREAMAAALQSQHKASLAGAQDPMLQSGSGGRNRGAAAVAASGSGGGGGTTAKNMRKTKEKRSNAKQVAKALPAITVAN
ncbi:interferon regulatory factor 5-like isoform X2 [Sycon ciliatum]|uniref:interferon regulatory factor 5-like isoform X2 n=1 Tax=Sycon ciliatum TaxID=27933 RepID=UPI0031F70755